jgi:hypothetical protein
MPFKDPLLPAWGGGLDPFFNADSREFIFLRDLCDLLFKNGNRPS